jgi:N-acetylglucosamine malate deacetylase 1
MKHTLLLTALLTPAALGLSGALAPAAERPLRIIAFGAHPDDCEIQASGSAALWIAKGHKVKFVSVSNGDIGHWRDAGAPLAKRRTAEVQDSAKVIGNEVQVLDIHDGEIMPTLENRRTIVRLIREWQADIVLCPRPNDYHPDHRYTSMLVQDAAYMVTVPFFCPDVPPLKANPVFAYFPDRFQKPTPFAPDVAVALDAVIEKKLDAIMRIESQFPEGGANGGPNTLPSDPDRAAKHRANVRQSFANRSRGIADRFRQKLIEFYGPEKGAKVQYAEAYEICEYGRQPSKAELKRLFPFFE